MSGDPSRYRAAEARTAACRRARRPKTPKLVRHAGLAAAVAERSKRRWSPAAISAEGLSVCAETICQACYGRSGRRGLSPNSWRRLPTSRSRRRPRRRCEQAKRSALGDYRPLAQRPVEAGDRDEPGHWEGDLVIGKANASAVAALVERTSRHTSVAPLLGGYDAQSTACAVSEALARQPAHLLKTLTWDQGRELARWADTEQTTGVEVFFCEPRSPRQRPSNEQTNGLPRRWPPKGTNLNTNPAHLAIIADNPNETPRKLHNWKPAADTYLCRNHH